MAASDEILQRLIESLSAEGCETGDFEADVIGMVGRLRKARERAIRDREAAQLLPLGAEVAAIRQECHRSTVYRRVSRFQKVARQMPNATKG